MPHSVYIPGLPGSNAGPVCFLVERATQLEMSVAALAIESISADEFVEATPKSLRLRKRILDATGRKRAQNAA